MIRRALMKHLFRPGLLLIAILSLGMLLAACGEDEGNGGTGTDSTETPTETEDEVTPTPTETSTSEPTETEVAETPTATETEVEETPTEEEPAEEPISLRIFFVRDENVGPAHREVEHTLEVGHAAMEELLAGPTSEDGNAGLSSEIPEGTELLNLSISNETAMVDLSGEFDDGGGSLSMQLRAAQVVYTLTQFPTVQEVSFSIDGEPIDALGGEGVMVEGSVGRGDFEEVTPQILVLEPLPGEVVTSPLQIQGTANTFEAAFMIEVIGPSGEQWFEDHAMATSGTGTRGTFDETIEFDILEPGEGYVVLWEVSMRDGSRMNEVRIPVTFE